MAYKNHSMCGLCWRYKYPNRIPHKLILGETESHPIEKCCFCGIIHNSGIKVRESDDKTICQTSWHLGETEFE